MFTSVQKNAGFLKSPAQWVFGVLLVFGLYWGFQTQLTRLSALSFQPWSSYTVTDIKAQSLLKHNRTAKHTVLHQQTQQ